MSIFTYLSLELSRSLMWDVAKAVIDFKGELYTRAVEQATVKSRHTMNSSQAGAYRSSITRNRSLFDGLKSFDIIGPYASAVKAGEGYADIYVRPLYEYTDFEKNIYSDLAFSQLMQNGLINLYIVGGCLKEDMKSK